MWGKMSYSRLIGIQTTETALEISLEFSQKLIIRNTIYLAILLLSIHVQDCIFTTETYIHPCLFLVFMISRKQNQLRFLTTYEFLMKIWVYKHKNLFHCEEK